MKKIVAVMAILLVFTWMPGGVVLGIDRFGPPGPTITGGSNPDTDDHPWGGDAPTGGTKSSAPTPTVFTGFLALDLVMSRVTSFFSRDDLAVWTKSPIPRTSAQTSALQGKSYAPAQATATEVTIFERRREN